MSPAEDKPLILLRHVFSAWQLMTHDTAGHHHVSTQEKCPLCELFVHMGIKPAAYLHTHSHLLWHGWPLQQCRIAHPGSAASVVQCWHPDLNPPSGRSLRDREKGGPLGKSVSKNTPKKKKRFYGLLKSLKLFPSNIKY